MRKTDQAPDHDPQLRERIEARSRDRVFAEDDRWFVRTREGLRGPFSSRRAAEAEAELFVDTVKFLEQNGPELPPGVDHADITVVDMDKTPWR